MAARAKKAVAAAASDVPPLNGDVFPVSDGPALKFVALDVIEIAGQVRTTFDEQALAELADDMKVRGVLQPVLLCSEVDGVYRLIAGERRVRAARMAGLSAVPALVGAATTDALLDMQLAENIQREDLSLSDEANAVRRLYDRWGKVDLVARHVKKSPAWVSKRLAMTYGDFDWRAKKLLEDGVTEDFDQICEFLMPPGSEIDILDWSSDRLPDVCAYFTDGMEWWGVFLFSLYLPALKRLTIIAGSSTD